MRDDSLAGDDQQVREDLKNLLRFTEQMLATREKTVFDIAEYPIRLTERDLMDAAGDPLPGVGFGPGGEGFVRFALIENEQRTQQAVRNMRRALTRLDGQ
jgi:hypothetical protein